MKTRLLILLAVFAAGLHCAVYPAAAPKPWAPEKLRSLMEGAETIGVIDESYGQVTTVHSPFFQVCQDVLECGGFKVVSGTEGCDAILYIRAVAAPIQAPYSDGRSHWTASRLDGRLVLQVKGRAFALPISGYVPPKMAIPEGSYLAPERAPYPEAFHKGFIPVILKVLIDIGGREGLVAALRTPYWDDLQQIVAEMGEPAIEVMISGLRDGDPGARYHAFEVLRGIRTPRVVEALIELAKDQEAHVRATGPRIVGGTTKPDALNAWFALAQTAAVLGHTDDPRAVEALIELLKSQESDVRSTIAGALRGTTDPRAIEALIAALKDRESEVRSKAASALRGTKDPRAIEALIAALEDQDPACRKSAEDSLGVITGQGIKDNPAQWRQWWDTVRAENKPSMP